MQDDTQPPIPVKDVPVQQPQTDIPVATPPAAASAPETASEPVPTKEKEDPTPKRPSSVPAGPVVISLVLLAALAAFAYLAFRGV